MVSVLIDKNTKKNISIVEGQKLKSTSEYDVHYTEKINESEILKELSSLGILGETVFFDILYLLVGLFNCFLITYLSKSLT